MPAEGQILVNIEDMSMLKDIKKAISTVKGVGKITLPRRQRISSYERDFFYIRSQKRCLNWFFK